MRLEIMWAAMIALPGAAGAPPQAVREFHMAENRFQPAAVEVRRGDTIRFVNSAGGPHNVQFLADSIPEEPRRLLDTAMPGDKIGPLSSPLLLEEGEVYQFVVPALPPGRYPFVCLPHAASGMKGVLVVMP